MDIINIDMLIELFECANRRFIKNEKELLFINVSERCICAALMHHIRNVMCEIGGVYDGYFADVEYNRIIDDDGHTKIKTFGNTTNENSKGQEDEENKFVCDLLVHGRGHKSSDDLIALEMKKSTAKYKCKACDKKRLKKLTSSVQQANNARFKNDYLLGVYYEIDRLEKKIDIIYYHKGKVCKTYSENI